jgi:hypothetical protein
MHWKKLVIENDEDVEGGDEDIDDYSCTARPSLRQLRYVYNQLNYHVWLIIVCDLILFFSFL